LKPLGPILTTILNDDYIHRHVPGFEEYSFTTEPCIGCAALPPPPPVRTIDELPVAWEKPPGPSAKDDLPADLLVNAGGTLRDAHQRLISELKRAGFTEIGLFYAPGGFMLVTKVERIHEDMTPYGGDDRWTKEKIPLRSLSLTEYLKRLFLEKPGLFRFFSFIVTTEINVETSGAELGEEQARSLIGYGGRGELPDKLAAMPYAGHRCHIFIYQFEKELGQGIKILIPSNYGARDHLAKAGLWNNPAIPKR
jgi:hypothetical protein